MAKTETILIRVSKEAKESAERIASANNMSLSAFVRLLLSFGLKFIEQSDEQTLIDSLVEKKQDGG